MKMEDLHAVVALLSELKQSKDGINAISEHLHKDGTNFLLRIEYVDPISGFHKFYVPIMQVYAESILALLKVRLSDINREIEEL